MTWSTGLNYRGTRIPQRAQQDIKTSKFVRQIIITLHTSQDHVEAILLQ